MIPVEIACGVAWARTCRHGARLALALGLMLPLGPLLYRIAFRPIADAPVLVLFMVSVVLHFAMSGVALIVFGPESARPRPLVDAAQNPKTPCY